MPSTYHVSSSFIPNTVAMLTATTLSTGIGLGLVIYVLIQALRVSKLPPLPPGPKGFPVFGNLKDLPPPGVPEATHWLKHKDLYGPISSVTVMGETIIVINDAKIAFELLDKRSRKYSSRPTTVFWGEMVGWGDSVTFQGYNDRFRKYRKNMARVIGSKTAAAEYEGLQEAEVAHFLLHVLEKPEKLVDHIRKEAGSVILKIAYNYTAEPFKEDVLIDMAGKCMDDFAKSGAPGTFLVDILPFLRYVPDWMPGTNFKRLARQWSAELKNLIEKPYAFVKYQRSLGKQDNSFTAQLLEAGDSTAEEQLTNKWSAASLYAAGADTTVSSLACFFLAMMIYPEVQRKAQEEIDRVIGDKRLPTMSDRSSMPYLDAMVKEVLRWHPIAPMGLPHTCSEDDIYEGYSIPKGSMVICNVLHFAHDPEVYDDPMAFKPRFTSGVVSHPEPFSAVVKPRSDHHEKLIRSLEGKYPWQNSDGYILERMENERLQ
ncbi:hypothetical protein FGRMN_2116 [Fusarium graminum]|nr:hypothetical protein FGRMN_2116 [Fusarium graminum]